jgi:hypothetical protein
MRFSKRLASALAASAFVATPLASQTPAQSPPAAYPTWAEQMEALKPVGKHLLELAERDDTDARRTEMNQYVLGAVANGYLNYVRADPARPTFTPLWNYAFNYGGPNPDYAYMFTLIDPKGTYRITGYRGTSRFVEITQQSGDFTSRAVYDATAKNSPAPTNDLDQLTIGKDGYFSVILSGERPAGYTGDWWPLAPTTMSLLMRKAMADWKREIDPRIAIDRLDEAPPLTAEQMAARFSNLKNWVATRIESEIGLVRYYRENHGVNTIKKSQLMAAAAPFKGQVYLDGGFEFREDEALVLETVVPKQCRYWQILLADDRFAVIDWVNRQSSLNDTQARLDADGKFRAVIAAKDPGVPNWLDSAGEKRGLIQMRWNRCSEAPDPVVTKIALKDVRKHVHKDTPIITPEQRKALLRERREAAQLRQLW